MMEDNLNLKEWKLEVVEKFHCKRKGNKSALK
jgi:hypothetical protein